MFQNATRIKLLKIWEILCQETDEEHPMPSTVLIDKLAEVGVSCERKTIYRDIETLCEYGYEVKCERAKKNQYYVVDRSFDLPELHILLDAVQGASFITEKKTKELVDKIADLAGSRKGEVLKRNLVAFNNTKNTNEVIYYTIDEIVRAISEKKKIEFKYFDYDSSHKKVYRKDGAVYKVNPYATIFSENNYYLLAYNDKNRKIKHYRVDRMDSVNKLKEAIIPLFEDNAEFDVMQHKKELFGMFGGEEERVTFDVDKSLLDVMFDKFGVKTQFVSIGDGKYRFSANIQVSPVFMGWCCTFGEKLKLVAPNKVVEKFKTHIESLKRLYSPSK
jgi:hypothetical protein